MIPEEPTPEQVQALIDACPQAAMFRYVDQLDGLHVLRRRTFWEDALDALRRRV